MSGASYRTVIGVSLSLLFAGCLRPQNGSPTNQAAQAATPPPTKMEAFKPSAGSVLTLGYDSLGRIGQVSVDVREMRDTKGGSVRGLVVDITESQFRQEQSFIDADEIPELLKGFDALLEIKDNPTKFKNFEVRYTTRGQLVLTAFNTNAGALRYSVKAGRLVGATAFLGAADMQNLRGLFDTASQKLATLGSPK